MAVQDLLDVNQCAAMLGFSEEHVRVLARKARIPAAKIGGRWRFSRRQVLEWFEDMAIPEAIVEEELAREAKRRLALNEPTRPFEEFAAELGL